MDILPSLTCEWHWYANWMTGALDGAISGTWIGATAPTMKNRRDATWLSVEMSNSNTTLLLLVLIPRSNVKDRHPMRCCNHETAPLEWKTIPGVSHVLPCLLPASLESWCFSPPDPSALNMLNHLWVYQGLVKNQGQPVNRIYLPSRGRILIRCWFPPCWDGRNINCWGKWWVLRLGVIWSSPFLANSEKT